MIKPFATLFFLFFFGWMMNFISASESNDKIVISKQEEVYTYEPDKKGGVRIKSEHSINYTCVKPGKVSFVEFYDNDVEINSVKIKGVKGVSPQYGMYKRENIFFSDSKACHFEIPFLRKDSEASVTFNKIYKDIRQFIFLPLAQRNPTLQRTIKFVVPDGMEVDILLQNASDNITKESSRNETGKSTVYTIQITNQPEYIAEENSPGYTHLYPYLLIVPKESNFGGKNEQYFKTVDNLYQWSREFLSLMQNDTEIVKAKSVELTANCLSDEEKIGELCRWVQQSIRYIAFADGISGFKPDEAHEVMAKKYGDCKGMSNLLKLLLLAAGFDARLTWVATNTDKERGLDVNNPVPFANHMICTLFWKDSLRYFDPTVESLSLGEIPEYLQGQTALIEDGENYIISQIPKYATQNNRDSLFIRYSIANGKLRCKADRFFRGESKHDIAYWMNNIPESEKKHLAEKFLIGREAQDSVFNIELEQLKKFLPEINIQYEIARKSVVSNFGNQLYINLNDTKDYENSKIDTLKRKTALKMPYRDYVVRTSLLQVPDEYSVIQLPENVNIAREKYAFSISYTQKEDTIIYHREISIFDTILEKDDFEQWNADIESLRKAYHDLIVLQDKTK